ncbi:RNase adapter RapZ [Silanimonas lenta]|uniref:RNase adapter RapZ n=1 Tax=Silanimonas lenta TaxID=265429 RepID=UPI002FDF1CB0
MSRSLTVVSGLSGSGKTVALRTLEDLGYYCVDNLPVDLLPAFVDSVGGEAYQKLAVGIDVRNHHADLGNIGEWLAAVGARGYQHRLLFFDTADETLIKRYSDTRRRHPLSQLGLALPDAIALERQVLRPVKALADHVLDTTTLNVHQLRKRVLTELEAVNRPGLTLLFESFAYKRGLPVDADFVFDTRCLPNPHWDPALRPLTGRDAAIQQYFAGQAEARAYLEQVRAFVAAWLPRFESESRSYLSIAFGCTGGRHRSVYLAESLAAWFREHGREDALTYHRELE